ncbi:MAG: 50S ribosomal protein L1 [Succinivibrio sp.]|uniref:Large ribosomal subunit protein uL1 n=1 Tax=Succinivibrio dextrinosolvens TaxID=83771 RepID=A0A662Z9N4_9GAMM|nr:MULTISPECIES: 50S ribosomal protein L1 [Succinivibrio]MBQ3884196.1 50S ribosomal protein L1 [Succinivibrio sp.]MBQ9220661.1 50S ribosomal protein L1 [Succinivibrio sp.]MDY6415949.1 50S ribosomal protein L1 [Succinivibrio dextrinosolvens]MDY6420276.1 50S ribosomal protein L1 [Succinivibrio dextrinosolvens]SFK12928.1 large subunit ribosomal protein L1 [Succinivibrio dextrinosolvens]
MAKIAKRLKEIRAAVDKTKQYDIKEGFELLKNTAKAKFVESVDVAIQLGIDATKSDQNVRGSTVLPHGTGKTVRVLVFTQGELAEQAKAAGADHVGMDELAAEVKKGFSDFDVVIASPDAMRVVGSLGQILGPRGLMPNPKVGTVTRDVATAVKNAKAGQVRFRNDKAGNIQTSIGKANFTAEQLADNLNALVASIEKMKPAAAKGTFIKKVSVSTTMGVGLTIDKATLGSKAVEA